MIRNFADFCKELSECGFSMGGGNARGIYAVIPYDWKEQEQFNGEHCFVDFTNPDFKMLAEAMHCKGYRVERAEDLIPTLEDAFRQTVPSVITVPVDYGENMKLSAHLKEVYQ